MNATDSAALKRWFAAGVRHEVLLRSLPSLRHDMAAPVSILRMATLLLKRQLAATSVDAAACTQRVTVLEQQMSGVIDGIRLLRGWEAGTEAGVEAPGSAVTRQALVAKCVSLLRPVFDLRGVSITLDPMLDEPSADAVSADGAVATGRTVPPEPAWPNGFALRYLLLASLCYLHDADSHAGTVHIAMDGPDGLDLRSTLQAADARPLMADATPPAAGRLEIDEAALQCLADDLGYAVAVTADGVRLRLVVA